MLYSSPLSLLKPLFYPVKFQIKGVATKNPYKKILIILLACSITIPAIFASPRPGAPSEPPAKRLSSAYTKLGFDLLSKISRGDAGKNIFISPSSIAFALSIAYNGAEGATKEEMAKALGLAGMDSSEINRANKNMTDRVRDPASGIDLDTANSIWVNKLQATLKPEFTSQMMGYYDAEIENIDFEVADAASKINGWVAEKTRGKIKEIISDRMKPGLSKMASIIVNAIYFKGQWFAAFSKELTEEREFTLPSADRIKIPMMSQSGEYHYHEESNFQAIRLPYRGRRASMYIFLPARNSSLREFKRQLTAENWDRWMGLLDRWEKPGKIILPRFKIEYSAGLREHFQAMGMNTAFRPLQANFKKMCNVLTGKNVFIGDILHKTFVDVNEEGTEAAAVTAIKVEIAASALSPPKRFEMRVDRPFFFVIRDDMTGLPLFMGQIADPRS